MTFKTRAQLIASIYSELALVAGSGVQTYTEPQVEESIQNSFDHLFSKRFWNHLTTTTFHTLDGAAGVTTDAIIGIENVADIKWIREAPFETRNDIPYIEDGIFNTDWLCYTTIGYTEAQYETKRLKFNPTTSTASIAIRARRKPVNFESETIVPMDYLMIKHLTTANLLSTDGMNPSAEAKQMALFEDRYATFVSNEGDKPFIAESPRFARTFTVAE